MGPVRVGVLLHEHRPRYQPRADRVEVAHRPTGQRREIATRPGRITPGRQHRYPMRIYLPRLRRRRPSLLQSRNVSQRHGKRQHHPDDIPPPTAGPRTAKAAHSGPPNTLAHKPPAWRTLTTSADRPVAASRTRPHTGRWRPCDEAGKELAPGPLRQRIVAVLRQE